MKSILLFILINILAIYSFAGTRIVANTNDNGIGSLRAEIDSAQSGDTIRFSPSLIASGSDSIVLTSQILITKGLTIVGLYNSSDSLILSGGGTNRIFYVAFASHFTLDSLIIENGFSSSADGGALYFNIYGDINIINSIIRNNTISYTSGSTNGAGIYALTDSSINLKNCIVSNNIANPARGCNGGGAFFQAENVIIENCKITKNEINSLFNSQGAGISIFFRNKLIVSNNLISNNSARSTSFSKSNGGGIFAASSGSTVSSTNSCVFSNNIIINNSTVSALSTSSGTAGGGIYVVSSSIFIVNNNISKNKIHTSGDLVAPTANSFGGGIYARSPSIIKIINSQFDSNIATSNSYKPAAGGGIYAYADSIVSIKNSSITRNSVSATNSQSNGGGIYIRTINSFSKISNCIVSKNSSTTTGGGVFGRTSKSIFIFKSQIDSNNSSFGGGGIMLGAQDSILIEKSSINNNSVITINDDSKGGGINTSAPFVKISYSTITGNSARATYNTFGGGIYNRFVTRDVNNHIYINNSTIANNLALSNSSAWASFASGIISYDSITLTGSIISNLTIRPSNFFAVNGFKSNGYNIFNDSSNLVFNTTDLLNIDSTSLNLGILKNNGGTTMTMVPLSSSVALDSGDPLDLTDAQNKPISGIRDRGAAENNCNDFTYINDTICGNYTSVTGKTWTTSGIYSDSLTNSAGCDSLFIYNLLINQYLDTITANACDSYMGVSGQIWNVSGTYKDTAIIIGGCDSTITTYFLTILNSSSSTINVNSCDSYTSPSGKVLTSSGSYFDTIINGNGCDSIITINLTINKATVRKDSLTSCDNFIWPYNGLTYSNDTIIRDTMFTSNSNGCDSIGYLNLTIINSTSSSISTTVCNQFTSPSGKLLTVSGFYQDTIPNLAGCDSVISINLTIKNSTSSTSNLSVCDSYISASGKNYTASGIYLDSIPNSVSCDSIITTNLTVNYLSTELDSIISCDSYVWPYNSQTYTSDTLIRDTIIGGKANGCDSISVLKLKINNSSSSIINSTHCNSFTSPSGKVYSSNGTYIDTITNVSGCDSIITFNLTFNYSTQFKDSVESCISYTWVNNGQTYYNDTIVHDTIVSGNSKGCDSINTMKITIKLIDTSISLIYPYLKANENSATYQWLDCNNSFSPISSGTSQWYTLLANGSYAVEVTKNGCVDTSNCITLNNVGIENQTNIDNITIYPNPTSDKLIIELGEKLNSTISIYDASGKLIDNYETVNSSVLNLNIKKYEEGVYLIKIETEGNYKSFRIVKMD